MSTADARIAKLEAENAALRADNDALRTQVQQLLGRVGELEARLVGKPTTEATELTELPQRNGE